MTAQLHLHTEVGPPCLYLEHSAKSKSGQGLRYTDTHACVRCVEALVKPGFSIDITRVTEQYRPHFLRFWSFVEIRGPDECWPWRGSVIPEAEQPRFSMTAPWLGVHAQRFSPKKMAVWFSWGDVGRLHCRNVCRTRTCCNPLHIRVQGVPHLFNRRRIDRIDLIQSTERLKAHTASFSRASMIHEPELHRRMRQVNPDWIDRVIKGALAEDD